MTRPSETIRSSASPSITLRLAVSRDRGLHRGRIELAVGLGARTADGRTLAAIEHPELDAAGIGDPAHQAVERIDLADQMALAEPADGGIAGHRADGRKAMGDQRRPRAHPRSGAAASQPAWPPPITMTSKRCHSLAQSWRDFYRGAAEIRKREFASKAGCFT